jgi:hypothetical protein
LIIYYYKPVLLCFQEVNSFPLSCPFLHDAMGLKAMEPADYGLKPLKPTAALATSRGNYNTIMWTAGQKTLKASDDI